MKTNGGVMQEIPMWNKFASALSSIIGFLQHSQARTLSVRTNELLYK